MGGVTNTTLSAITIVSAEYVKNNITHIAVGDSAIDFNTTQTTLGNEVFRKLADDVRRVGTEVRTRVRFDVTEGNSNTFRETGNFDSGSGGVMLSRNIITPFIKTNEKELTIVTRNIFSAKNKI